MNAIYESPVLELIGTADEVILGVGGGGFDIDAMHIVITQEWSDD